MANPINLINGGLTYYSFYDSDKPNYIFANYWPQPLTVGGVIYKTPEHYFQAQKFSVGSREHTVILNARSADEAHREATRLFQDPTAKDHWFGGGDYNAMLNVVRERLEQDPDFKKELMSTGTGYILEDTYKGSPLGGPADNRWGGGADGMGQNLLGMALMEVRNEEFRRLNKIIMIVDQKQLRKQAQRERQQINSTIQGGVNATEGKSLSQIHLHMIQTNSTDEAYTPQKEPTSKGRVMAALGSHNAKNITIMNDINKRGSKVLKVTFQDPSAARAFSRFAGNAMISRDGLNVILGPKRAQSVFETLGVGQHGRNHPRPMFEALVFDDKTIETKKTHQPYGEKRPDTLEGNLRDSEKELFQDAFNLISNLSVDSKLKEDLHNVFQDYQTNIGKDRYSDTTDEFAYDRLNQLIDAYGLDRQTADKLSNLVKDIKIEVVSNNPRLK